MTKSSTPSMRRCAAVMSDLQLAESVFSGRLSIRYLARHNQPSVIPHYARWLAVLRLEARRRGNWL